MDLAIIIAVVVVALAFDYTNGFHDAANAIATSVSTRALTPRIALAMAAVMNFLGAFLGQKVASTVSDVITPPADNHGLVVVMAGLLGAIAWNLLTWYYGLPSSSSSHALIGGLGGAAIGYGLLHGDAFGFVKWDVILDKIVIPMVASPVFGFLIAAALTVWAIRKPRWVLPGLARRNSHMIAIMTRAAAAKPNSGEAIIGMTIFSRMTSHLTKLHRSPVTAP